MYSMAFIPTRFGAFFSVSQPLLLRECDGSS
jgi:hypothetical protein